MVVDAGLPSGQAIPDDFWGHGNFNQQNDFGCVGFTCCDSYFMGNKTSPTRVSSTQNIRNEMYISSICPVCVCGEGTDGCSLLDRPAEGSSLLQQTCEVTPQQGEWYLSYGGDAILEVQETQPALSEAVYSFEVSNSIEPRTSPNVTISLVLSNFVITTPLDFPSGEASPLVTVPHQLFVSSIVQTYPFLGGENTLRIEVRPNMPLIRNTRLTVSGLLPVSILFAVTTSASCRGSSQSIALPYGPNEATLEGAFVSYANENLRHSHWRQELYDNDVLKFTILWSFSAPKTLTQRLAVASDTGETVEWMILPDGSSEGRTKKRGTWKISPPSKVLGRFSTVVAFGGATGLVDAESFPPDFWGHANFASRAEACNSYFMNGVPTLSEKVVSRIYLEQTPVFHLSSAGKASFEMLEGGGMLLTALTRLEADVTHEVLHMPAVMCLLP